MASERLDDLVVDAEVNFCSFELWFFANILVFIVVSDYVIKNRGQEKI